MNKEKGDHVNFVRYSTQSKGYRLYNMRTRLIVETIHVNFDELPLMVSDHVSSDPAPQCQATTLEQVSLSPVPQSQENVPLAEETVTMSLNELDMLFSLMFDEYFNGATSVVSKSSAVSTADASDKHQQQPDSTSSTSTPGPMFTADGNFDLIKIYAHMVAASKVPMLKPVMPITTAREKTQRRLEVKARSTLMMGIPNEHQLKFNSIKDAKRVVGTWRKEIWWNATTKKTQWNLKEAYENFLIQAQRCLIKLPPPYIGNFMPLTPDLSFTGLDEFANKPVVENCKAISSEEEPKVVRRMICPNYLKNGCPDDEEEGCVSA
ncbi:hypothetical protein Tco_0990685 [Tanacetum coccineum]|uniref:Retroviral polymerase SH3-like domain-containing protein n=1 Tax=Tanacetum coccineum TaxID=301880 RepID=A0ABQ5EX71_9ASTR